MRPSVRAAGAPSGLKSRRGRHWRQETDDGGSETIEIVLVLPLLMLLVVAGLQLAMWGLAAHALNLGVAEAGAEARSASGGREAATAVAGRDIHYVAGSLVQSLLIEVRPLPDEFVSVSATGTVPTIIPGLHLHVSAVSSGPSEVFRANG